jgi:hypothetical protein
MTMPIGERSVDLLRGFGRHAKPYLIPLALSSVLAVIAVHAILERAGRPALPLDDSFIHLQFARRFAEGHPMTFSNGGGVSSGATSFLWPLMLAPFALFGMHGLTLVYAAWILGTVFHAAVILETFRLTEPLAGRAAAIAAGAMCLLFGAFTWFAWSGMETIAFTWALVRTARVASEWLEQKPHERTLRSALGLAFIGAVAPLLRPEGALAAGGAFLALVIATPSLSSSRGRFASALYGRIPALPPIAGVALVPILNLALTGHARSATAMVKWYVGNPYVEGSRLIGAIGNNVRMLLTDLLAGGPYTTIFVPEGAHYLFGAGFIALLVSVFRKLTTARALAVMLIVLGTLMPCTFSTILWNRVRYIWPFAPGWFVLVVCLGKELGNLLERVVKGSEHLAVIVPAIFAGALGVKLSWTISDLATSARAIDHQQVTLGLWAADNLPKDARIGVNDTGAIAYLSGRRTFDVVGLTTEGEARYWVEGAGSRYEHYERMPISELPTHFIVYPQWMAVDPILGEELTRATVTDQSILGGATKIAYEANYDVLGRGSLPMSLGRKAPMFADMDVSDLESEADHGFVVGISNEGQNQVFSTLDYNGNEIADGGRIKRLVDRFNVRLDSGRSVRMVMRVGAEDPTTLVVSFGGAEVGRVEVPYGSWNELELTIPGANVEETNAIRVESSDHALAFTSMHYWFFAIPQ